MFDPLIGNESIQFYLKRAIAKKNINHAWLFAGPEGVGKERFAYAFAAELILSEGGEGHRNKLEKRVHPDIHFYKPEGKIGLHSIDAMRQFTAEVNLVPFESPWKVFIILDADRMLPSSANALLKTFEEPSKNTLIILVSSQPYQILPTILSRCVKVYFQTISSEQILHFLQQRYDKSHAELKYIAELAKGSIKRSIQLLEQNDRSLETNLIDFLASKDQMQNYGVLHEFVNLLDKQFETERKEREKILNQEFYQHSLDLSAIQKEEIEKEIAGTMALQETDRLHQLLVIIIYWYRDLHILANQLDRKFLMQPVLEEQLKARLKQGDIPPMEKVQAEVEQVQLGMERFMKLSTSLESLFLSLASF